ncbi:hypothetical protein F4804DRAFT_217871 [Jackrogersella minutella]|nr:hypothetical protein F4804DRAFT_217871 [Jackrogersella minutella]
MIVMEQPTSGDHNEQRAVGKPNRTRPLRTYSKRASSTDVAEPSLKKRRIESTALTVETKTIPPARESSVSLPSPILRPSQPAKKGSIMSYFKVIPSESNTALPSSEPTSEPTIPESTPPSSPPTLDLQRRKRRRLMTRAIPRLTPEDLNAEDIVEGEDDEEPDGKSDGSKALASRKDALSDASLNALNRPATREKKRVEAGKRGRASKIIVQTTLSISTSDKGFVECKECNMLYNPLHKEDAKCHTRRHAAMLKEKLSSQNDEILE